MTRHQITRIRHEIRRRTLTIAAIEQLGPQMRRIHFHSEELHDFTSASADDHIKLFFPAPDSDKPQMRDYTPRRFDTSAGTLVIDFALHGGVAHDADLGPATRWARSAQVGDTLEIGGPRGSAVIPDDFDWYILIGDETALPAIGRRVEELRAGVPVTTIALVDGAESEQTLTSAAALDARWVHRQEGQDDAALLKAALATITPPPGEGFIWIGAETAIAKALRAHVLDTMGHPREWLKAAGYWTRGEADAANKALDD